MDVGAAYALLCLPNWAPKIPYRFGDFGLLCLGRENTCQNTATASGYCLRCAYRVNPHELSVAQVFSIKGDGLVIHRNSARYIRGAYKSSNGEVVRVPRKLCCGNGNQCDKNARCAGLCVNHIKEYREKLRSLPQGTILEEGEMRIVLGHRGDPIQLCAQQECPFASKRTGYCMDHFRMLRI